MLPFIANIIRYWALFGGALLILVVFITAINAVGFSANFVARFFGSNVPGLPGYEDAVTMLVGVAGLAMFPYCQLHNGHAAVDVFMQNAPKFLRRSVDLIAIWLVVIVTVGLCYSLVLGVIESKADAVETSVLGWPVWVFMMMAIPSIILWSLAAIISRKIPLEN